MILLKIVVCDDNVAVALSPMNKLWFMKSMDNWGEGVVFERLEIDVRREREIVCVVWTFE